MVVLFIPRFFFCVFHHLLQQLWKFRPNWFCLLCYPTAVVLNFILLSNCTQCNIYAIYILGVYVKFPSLVYCCVLEFFSACLCSSLLPQSEVDKNEPNALRYEVIVQAQLSQLQYALFCDTHWAHWLPSSRETRKKKTAVKSTYFSWILRCLVFFFFGLLYRTFFNYSSPSCGIRWSDFTFLKNTFHARFSQLYFFCPLFFFFNSSQLYHIRSTKFIMLLFCTVTVGFAAAVLAGAGQDRSEAIFLKHAMFDFPPKKKKSSLLFLQLLSYDITYESYLEVRSI